MIKYNLVEQKYKNHPDDYKYGIMVGGSLYDGYTVTIVDNSKESKDGYVTEEPTVCLLHLSDRVRQYEMLRVNRDFSYISYPFGEVSNGVSDYNKVELSKLDVIRDLSSILYKIQPRLQEITLMGYDNGDSIEGDINHYQGTYVLNDENEYSIIKHKNNYRFYKGRKTFSNGHDLEGLIYEGEMDYSMYVLAIELAKLKYHIVINANKMLENEEDNSVEEYRILVKELDEKLRRNEERL